MTTISHASDTWSAAVRLQLRIIGALILRDMRTRFGRTHAAYIIAIAWPLSHLTALVLLNSLIRRVGVVPLGTDSTIFVSTGLLPYILCLYPARMVMVSIITNRAALNFSIIKTTDIIFARITLEILNAFFVAMIFSVGLYIADINFVPVDNIEAIEAIFASVYLGVAFGFYGAISVAVLGYVAMVIFILTMIGLYATSGVFFLPTMLPEGVRNILWYNPLLHCVEWLRSAFYEGYGDGMLSKTYVLCFASTLLTLGLVGDRLFRGRLMTA